MTSLSGKNNLIEDILEKAGAIHTLQSFRMKAWYSSQGNFATDLAELFEIEKILRKLYQLEIASKNELKKTLDNTIDESDGAIEILQESLQYVGRAYWATERMWWERRKASAPVPSSGVSIYGARILDSIFTAPFVRTALVTAAAVVVAVDAVLSVRLDRTDYLVLVIVRKCVTVV